MSGAGDDSIDGGADNDTITGGTGNDSIDGGEDDDGNDIDQARFGVAGNEFTVLRDGDGYIIISEEGVDRVTDVEEFVFTDTTLSAAEMDERAGTTTANNWLVVRGDEDDFLRSGEGDDTVFSGGGDDTVVPLGGNNWIFSGDGADLHHDDRRLQ